MNFRLALVLLFVVVAAGCSASEEVDNAESIATPTSASATTIAAISTTPADSTSIPSTPTGNDNVASDDSLDPYLLTMLELTRFIGAAMWPPIMLDGIDWRAAQQVMIDAGPEIRAARSEVEDMSPPETCSEFHSVWLDVMTELEARIALGVDVTGKMVNDDQAGALQLSGEYDYQQELYVEMDRSWRACHESIDPEWEQKIGIQK